jgi:hypothetical protein
MTDIEERFAGKSDGGSLIERELLSKAGVKSKSRTRPTEKITYSYCPAEQTQSKRAATRYNENKAGRNLNGDGSRGARTGNGSSSDADRTKNWLRSWNSDLRRAVVLIRNLQFPRLINSCRRIAENSRDITESDFCTILQLSISNRNAIDLCPIC